MTSHPHVKLKDAPSAATAQPIDNTFSLTLIELNRGKALGELSEALEQLVAEVKQTGKSGELTYTIKIEPLDNDAEQVQLKDEIKLKHPKQKRKETVMFTTEDNRLTRKPNTPELPGLQVVSDDKAFAAKSVGAGIAAAAGQ